MMVRVSDLIKNAAVLVNKSNEPIGTRIELLHVS